LPCGAPLHGAPREERFFRRGMGQQAGRSGRNVTATTARPLRSAVVTAFPASGAVPALRRRHEGLKVTASPNSSGEIERLPDDAVGVADGEGAKRLFGQCRL